MCAHKTAIPYDNGHFFITFTYYKWLSLIAVADGYNLIYKSFDILKSQGHFVIGFDIMPNPVHVAIAFKKQASPSIKSSGMEKDLSVTK